MFYEQQRKWKHFKRKRNGPKLLLSWLGMCSVREYVNLSPLQSQKRKKGKKQKKKRKIASYNFCFLKKKSTKLYFPFHLARDGFQQYHILLLEQEHK